MTETGAAGADDGELVRLAQAGDAEAFGELVERHRRAVFRAALAAVASPAEADDVAQETCVTAFRKLGQFRGESSFRTWLLAIAWRKATDRRKLLTRWIRLIVSPSRAETRDPIDMAPSSQRSQEAAAVDAELQRHIRTLIATLPHRLRDALLLAISGEHSYEEIGRMLDAPVGTVKWRVSEARRVLKQKLSALGYAGE